MPYIYIYHKVYRHNYLSNFRIISNECEKMNKYQSNLVYKWSRQHCIHIITLIIILKHILRTIFIKNLHKIFRRVIPMLFLLFVTEVRPVSRQFRIYTGSSIPPCLMPQRWARDIQFTSSMTFNSSKNLKEAYISKNSYSLHALKHF